MLASPHPANGGPPGTGSDPPPGGFPPPFHPIAPPNPYYDGRVILDTAPGGPVERAEIILMTVGLVLPVVGAPFVVMGQRRLFSIFFTEGVDILGNITMARKDALLAGALLAKLNVLVLLVAWLALFTCRCFHQPVLLLSSIALAGIMGAITVTTLIVHTNVRRLDAKTVVMVGLIVFTGGNLPLIVITAALMAFL